MNLIHPTGILRVTAPHYVAAAIWERGRCVRAAPIIGWMVGKGWPQIHRYLHGKGYEWVWIRDEDLTPELKGPVDAVKITRPGSPDASSGT